MNLHMANTRPIYIDAIGFAAPGMHDFTSALPILQGVQTYVATDLPNFQPTLLPANERRRASPTVRLAFRVAEAALTYSNLSAASLATVFASSDGDLHIANRICAALAQTPRLVSPTDFHNSVHNAAAGYWSIANHAHDPSTAVSGWDSSFTVGLLEALGLLCIEERDTLLVVYDFPAPPPLHAKRPITTACGVALVLRQQASPKSLAKFNFSLSTAAATTLNDACLETLRLSNPAARALPLLHAIACQQWGTIYLPHVASQSLRLEIYPAHE